MDKTNNIWHDKKGFLIRDWIIVMLVFGASVAFFAIMATDLANTYDNPNVTSDTFQDSYDTFTDTKANASAMYDTLTKGGGLSVIGTANLMFQSVFTVFNLVLNSLMLPAHIMKNFMVDYGIPDAIGTIFMALYVLIPTVIIIFVILSSQSRRDI